jgi:hypothetical protein
MSGCPIVVSSGNFLPALASNRKQPVDEVKQPSDVALVEVGRSFGMATLLSGWSSVAVDVDIRVRGMGPLPRLLLLADTSDFGGRLEPVRLGNGRGLKVGVVIVGEREETRVNQVVGDLACGQEVI